MERSALALGREAALAQTSSLWGLGYNGGMRLDDRAVNFFRDEGYLIVPDLWDPAELEPLRRTLGDCLARFEGQPPLLNGR